MNGSSKIRKDESRCLSLFVFRKLPCYPQFFNNLNTASIFGYLYKYKEKRKEHKNSVTVWGEEHMTLQTTFQILFIP